MRPPNDCSISAVTSKTLDDSQLPRAEEIRTIGQARLAMLEGTKLRVEIESPINPLNLGVGTLGGGLINRTITTDPAVFSLSRASQGERVSETNRI